MENECDHGNGGGGAVAMAIRELAAAVRATVPEPPADPDALLTAEEVGSCCSCRRGRCPGLPCRVRRADQQRR